MALHEACSSYLVRSTQATHKAPGQSQGGEGQGLDGEWHAHYRTSQDPGDEG